VRAVGRILAGDEEKNMDNEAISERAESLRPSQVVRVSKGEIN
jgi:hypothetical protein